MSKYGIIYADPPWDYGTKNHLDLDKINRKGHKGGKGINIETHYPTMQNEEIANLTIKDTDIMKYGVVYADPPWKYARDIDNAFKKDKRTRTLHVDNQYPTMENEEIAALSISDMLEDDAACFMWTTDAHLPYALEIMKAWGFTYKTIGFVWVKKSKMGKQIKMVAPWTNKGAEICLFGTKGGMTKHLGSNSIAQVVEAERTIHSKKPEEVAHRIEQMFPNLKKIELFARRQRPGWDVWGNDPNICNSIQLDEAESEHSAPAKATPRIRPLYTE